MFLFAITKVARFAFRGIRLFVSSAYVISLETREISKRFFGSSHEKDSFLYVLSLSKINLFKSALKKDS